MAAGWIKLHRQLRDHELWTTERFTRGQAWVDMLMLANFEPNTIRIRGIEVKLERGVLAWSKLHLSQRWHWNRRTVDKFLKELSTRKMIHTKTNSLTTVISILKYDTYQNNAQQSAHREEVKEVKEDLKNNEKGSSRKRNERAISLEAFLSEAEKQGELLEGKAEAIGSIQYFLEQYELHRSEKHPRLKYDQWLFHIDTMLCGEDGLGRNSDYTLENSERMINSYFKAPFDNCDYRLHHYNTKGIKNVRFYDTCF